MPGFTINTVHVSGNLTRDPELRSLASGTELCRFSIAVNERVKRNGEWTDQPNYFDVTVWGGIGSWLATHLHKGDGIVVQGHLRWRSWTTPDGNKRSAVEIVGESVVPMPRDGARSSGSSGNGGQRQRQPVPTSADAAGDFDRPLPADDDIPF